MFYHSPSALEPMCCAKPKHALRCCQQCIKKNSSLPVCTSSSRTLHAPQERPRAVSAKSLHTRRASVPRSVSDNSKALCDMAHNASHQCIRRVRHAPVHARPRHTRALRLVACAWISTTTKNSETLALHNPICASMRACFPLTRHHQKKIGRSLAADRSSVVDGSAQCSSPAISAA